MTSTPAHVLIVAPDPSTVATLAARISAERLGEVVIASSPQAARDAMTSAAFDVLLIDADLPDGDGLALLDRSARGRGAVCFLLGAGLTKTQVLTALRH